MTFLDNLSPEELIIITNAISISLSKDKTAIEMDVLGNFIVGIGCLLLTMAAQQANIEFQQQSKQPTPGDDIIG
ncbi:MAG TPA: hypothetical protein VIK26_07525 [Clostridium sp.]